MLRFDRTCNLPNPRIALIASGLFLTAGCGWIHPAKESVAPTAGHLITYQAIIASGGTTAWDVLKRTSFISTRDDKSGGPGKMWHRGHGSILLNDTPLVTVDGVPQTDFRVLGTIPANTIDNIRILNATEGAYMYGTRAGGGAILIQTRMDLPPQR
jgi:outer membrane cobalamin receptor